LPPSLLKLPGEHGDKRKRTAYVTPMMEKIRPPLVVPQSKLDRSSRARRVQAAQRQHSGPQAADDRQIGNVNHIGFMTKRMMRPMIRFSESRASHD